MGRILAPHGVKGWVKVEPFTGSPDNLKRYATWWVGSGGSWRQVRVGGIARHGSGIIVRIEGCDSREQAAQWRGVEIAVPRDALPSAGPNEFYQADLIGLAVVNDRGERLGRLTGLSWNGAHEVMRIEDSGRERLLPFVPEVVRDVDLSAGEIRVSWERDW